MSGTGELAQPSGEVGGADGSRASDAQVVTRPGSLALLIRTAERDRRRIDLHTTVGGELTVSDAYRVQDAYVAARSTEGARVVGYKIGRASTGRAYGALFDDRMAPSGVVLRLDQLISPIVEIEIAFRFVRRLGQHDVRAADVLAAVETIGTAFEVVDSRIAGGGSAVTEIAADNGHAAYAIMGEHAAAPSEWHADGARIVLARNGAEIAGADAKAAYASAIDSLAWLARTVAAAGRAIEPDTTVLSGAILAVTDIASGDELAGSIQGLGSVRCAFR